MQIFTAENIRPFNNKYEYLKLLHQYCDFHNHIYQVEADSEPGAMMMKDQMEEAWKKALGIQGSVSIETIGLDPDDTQRFMLFWAENYSSVLIQSYCNAYTGDYNDKIKLFCRNFFNTADFTNPEEANI